MSLPREKATHKADLPHQYEGKISLGCDVCGDPFLGDKHVAWERAHEQGPSPVSLPRETGV